MLFLEKGKIEKAIKLDPVLYESYYPLGKIPVNEKIFEKAKSMFNPKPKIEFRSEEKAAKFG